MAGNLCGGCCAGVVAFAALTWACGFAAAAPVPAAVRPGVVAQTFSSTDGRLSVTTPVGALSRTLMGLLEGMVVKFDELFPVEGGHRGRLRVVVEAGGDGVSGGNYLRRVRLGEKGLVFTLFVRTPPPMEQHEFIVATTELLLYDFCTSVADVGGLKKELPQIPFWLIDGTAQVLAPAEHREDLKAVVRAMAKRQRVPSIAVIQGWRSPSESNLEAIYQSAFCYWLFQELLRAPDYHQALLSWLRELWCKEEEAPMLWPDVRTVEKWWSETVARSTSVVQGANWNTDETRELLDKVLVTELNDGRGARRRFEFAELVTAQRDALFFIEMKKKEQALLTLVQRGDILFRAVPAAYLGAVQALIVKLPDAEFRKRAERAAAERAQLDRVRSEVRDYLDWFEVARIQGNPERDFAGYFSTWRSLERLDVRPQDPVSPPRLRVGAGGPE